VLTPGSSRAWLPGKIRPGRPTLYYGFLGYFAKLVSSIDSLVHNLRASAIWTSTGRKGTLGSGSLVCPSVTGFGRFYLVLF